MVVLNRIYTRTGDGGQTRLASGAPVSKTDPRVEAMGAVDELNAVIGVARLHSGQNDRIDAMLGRIQNELFDLGADLATPLEPAPAWEALRILDSQVERLEQEIDWMNESLKALDSFILPGGSPLSAHLHLARTVARRAERDAVRLVESGETVNGAAVRYLNRLSDHLFCAARRANANGAGDIKWKPGATR
ncbi:cob(I)yrinic acid a,c-diamide adenosyltransferase [Brevundimonas sp. M20]|uniref:cob(I)yrinic acid a,c-diamide adenosyltransferase n=1 Tax=Brevundimonas sp. M20 TaxID=2591463 RepID=UPI00114790AE|nr:cob(I)yrinic acid a,c-diamide adenosyltransferase [Brevundimonas sp. M20]QDH74852.1 cob(I)yrinic acid a,c-diamide adenosyltransferase [Brevundimonas sp. M20]